MPKISLDNSVGAAKALIAETGPAGASLNGRVEYGITILAEGTGPGRVAVNATRWHVVEMSIVEEISGTNAARVRVFSEMQGIEPGALVGASVRLAITRREMPGRHFAGVVRWVTAETHDGSRLLELVVEPAFFSLETVRRRSFTDRTVPEIVDEVLGEELGRFQREASWKSARLRETETSPWRFPRRERCVQYGEKDVDFVRRILAEEGVAYVFDHSGERERIVLVDGNEGFSNRAEPVRFAAAVEGSFPAGLRTLTTTFGRMPARVDLETFDFTSTSAGASRRAFKAVPDPSDVARQQGAVGHHEYREVGAPARLTGFADGSYRASDVEVQAKLRLEELRRDGEVAHGEGHVVDLGAGTIFRLFETQTLGTATPSFLVTRIVHHGRAHPTC